MGEFKSKAQQRKFADMLNEKKISKKVMDDFTENSKGKDLPERLGVEKIKKTDDIRGRYKALFGVKGKK